VYFDGYRKASLYYILRDRWKQFQKRFGLSIHLEIQWAPRRHYTHVDSIESVSLCWLGVARVPLWRGARLEEIGQIGLKQALCKTQIETERQRLTSCRAMCFCGN